MTWIAPLYNCGMLCQVLLDHSVKATEIRTKTYQRISRKHLLAAGAEVENLTRPPDDNYYEELVDRYNSVRRFLPTLLRTVSFEGIQAGQPLLDAWAFLGRIENQRRPDMRHAPLEGVPSAWRRLVKPPRQADVDRRAYTLCTLERLQDSLRRRDVFVARSERWGNPRIKLLQGAQWEATRSQVCRALNRNESPEPELEVSGASTGRCVSTDRGELSDQRGCPYRTGERSRYHYADRAR